MPTGVTLGPGAEQPDDESLRMLNMLGDRPEAIAPWFAQRILENPRNGARLTWLTGWRIAWRLVSAPILRRKVV